MTNETGEEAKVLVVDDEAALADLIAAWLEDTYIVDTATSGQEALDQITDDTDVVLLDRRMPRLSGDDVLEKIRERNIDCKVVMVTAVDPELDITQMEFDEYVTKPVNQEEILELVAEMIERASYDDWSQRFFALISKKETLEANMNEDDLVESQEYAELEADIATALSKMDDARDSVIRNENSTALFREPWLNK